MGIIFNENNDIAKMSKFDNVRLSEQEIEDSIILSAYIRARDKRRKRIKQSKKIHIPDVKNGKDWEDVDGMQMGKCQWARIMGGAT